MALPKKVVGACLACLWLTFFWVIDDRESQGHSGAVYSRGVESCRVCHQAIFDTFIQTAHFKTSARAGDSSITAEGKGKFSDGLDGGLIIVRAAAFHFEIDLRGSGAPNVSPIGEFALALCLPS